MLTGAISAVAAESGGALQTAERAIRLWRRLGLPLSTVSEQALVTPAWGLVGMSPVQARAALSRCREAAAMLPELVQEAEGSQHD